MQASNVISLEAVKSLQQAGCNEEEIAEHLSISLPDVKEALKELECEMSSSDKALLEEHNNEEDLNGLISRKEKERGMSIMESCVNSL